MAHKNNILGDLAPTAYNDFYFRNNIAATNALPSNGPFNLCPDIIQSDLELSNPQATLGSQSAYAQTFNTAPTYGKDNYYYLRGTNANNATVSPSLGLFYTPAQLIMHPETWQKNAIPAGTSPTQQIKVGTGDIGVTPAAFVLKDAQTPKDADFYSFAAQSQSVGGNPIPTITSWADMSDLLVNNLGFGFRNTCYVESDSVTWQKNFLLSVPSGITSPGSIMITLTLTGFEGNTITLVDNNNPSTPIISSFVANGNNPEIITAMLPLTAGYSGSLGLQYENTGSFPSSGSSIAVSALYEVPSGEVVATGMKGLLNHKFSEHLSSVLNMPHNQYAYIGNMVFVAE